MTATVTGVYASDRSGREDETYLKESELIYIVTTDDKNDGPLTVMSATGLPEIGDAYAIGNDSDTDLRLISREPTQTDSPQVWQVACVFSNVEQDATNNPSERDNPLQVPVVRGIEFVTRTVPALGRYSDPENPSASGDFDQLIKAPNGQPFTPQPTVEIDEPVLWARANLADPFALLTFNNCVNLNAYQGYKPRQLKLKIRAVPKTHATIGTYYTTTARMHFRYETWDLQVLNQGTYYLEGGWDGKGAIPKAQIRYVPDDLHPQIVNLKSNGDLNEGTQPTFSRIRYYREIDFNSLGF